MPFYPPRYETLEQELLDNVEVTGAFVINGINYTVLGPKSRPGYTYIRLQFNR